MDSFEAQELEVNKLVQSLYRDVGGFQLHMISNEMIESFKTEPKYKGLYELLEIFLKERTRSISNTPIQVETPYKIIQKFVEVANIKINLFNAEESTEKLLFIQKQLDSELEEKLEPTYSENLEILHNRVCEKLNIPKKYPTKVENEYNLILKRLEQARNDREKFTKECDAIKKEYPTFSPNYFKFIAMRKGVVINPQTISSLITDGMNLLFPAENIHPLFKKYKDLMTLIAETEILAKLRLNKKYEYSEYKLTEIPYEDYSAIYNHAVEITRLSFASAISRESQPYLDYICDLIKSESILVNISVFSDYISVLYRNGLYKEIYKFFCLYKKQIFYGLHRHKTADETIFHLIMCILTVCLKLSKVVCIEDFLELNIKYSKNATTISARRQVHKIRIRINYIRRINKYLQDIGFELPETSSTDDTCAICMQEIDEPNYQVVKCRQCKREIGHIHCMINWAIASNSCPLCRYLADENNPRMNQELGILLEN